MVEDFARSLSVKEARDRAQEIWGNGKFQSQPPTIRTFQSTSVYSERESVNGIRAK